jgi:phosphocarrier protein HPr
MSVSKEFTIVNKLGLHARASATLVRIASKYSAEVTIAREGQAVNGKSILGMMTLAAAQGTKVQVVCKGDDEKEAIEAIGACIADRFGEGE